MNTWIESLIMLAGTVLLSIVWHLVSMQLARFSPWAKKVTEHARSVTMKGTASNGIPPVGKREWAPWTHSQRMNFPYEINELRRLAAEFYRVKHGHRMWADASFILELLWEMRKQYQVVIEKTNSFEGWMAAYHQTPRFNVLWKRKFLRRAMAVARHDLGETEQLMILVATHHPKDLCVVVHELKWTIKQFFLMKRFEREGLGLAQCEP